MIIDRVEDKDMHVSEELPVLDLPKLGIAPEHYEAVEKAVKELESEISAEVVARGHGVTRATLYNWKSKYSGMDVSQVRRLKELEEENRKLKQIYADLALDNRILRDVIEKKL